MKITQNVAKNGGTSTTTIKNKQATIKKENVLLC